eukprot:gene4411-801_t
MTGGTVALAAPLPAAFILHYLNRKDKEFWLYLELIVYSGFLTLFTVSLILGNGPSRYYASKAVMDNMVNAELPTGPGTGLSAVYAAAPAAAGHGPAFTSTEVGSSCRLTHPQSRAEFWDFLLSANGLRPLLEADTVNGHSFTNGGHSMKAGSIPQPLYTQILPFLRVMQTRHKADSSRCGKLESLLGPSASYPANETTCQDWPPVCVEEGLDDEDRPEASASVCGLDYPYPELSGWRRLTKAAYEQMADAPVIRTFPRVLGTWADYEVDMYYFDLDTSGGLDRPGTNITYWDPPRVFSAASASANLLQGGATQPVSTPFTMRTIDKVECMRAAEWVDDRTDVLLLQALPVPCGQYPSPCTLHVISTAQYSTGTSLGPQVLALQLFLYDPSTTHFTSAQFISELGRTGSWFQSVHMHTFPVISFSTGTAMARVALNIAVFVWVCLYVIWLAYQVCRHILSPYLSVVSYIFENSMLPQVWFVMELLNLVLFAVGYGCMFALWAQLPEVQLVVPIDPASPLAVGTMNVRNFLTLTSVWASIPTAYADSILFLNALNAFNGLLCWLKVFKFFAISPLTSLMTDTIKDSLQGIISLLLYVFMITVAFSMMASVLYGNHLDDYRTFLRTISSLSRMVLGDFDYQELQRVDEEMTALFFLLFMVVVWIVVMNLIIGIISEGFASAQQKQQRAVSSFSTQIAQTTSVIGFKQMVHSLKRRLAPLVRTLSSKGLADRLENSGTAQEGSSSATQRQKIRSCIRWNRVNSNSMAKLLTALHKHLDAHSGLKWPSGWNEVKDVTMSEEDLGVAFSKAGLRRPLDTAADLWATLCSNRRSIQAAAHTFFDQCIDDHKELRSWEMIGLQMLPQLKDAFSNMDDPDLPPPGQRGEEQAPNNLAPTTSSNAALQDDLGVLHSPKSFQMGTLTPAERKELAS